MMWIQQMRGIRRVDAVLLRQSLQALKQQIGCNSHCINLHSAYTTILKLTQACYCYSKCPLYIQRTQLIYTRVLQRYNVIL